MHIEVVKSKIHRVTVTEADLNYVGSITIDEDLMDAANLIENEKVQIVNINNGERLETYVITGQRGSGQICLNGPAARKVAVGDIIIIINFIQKIDAVHTYRHELSQLVEFNIIKTRTACNDHPHLPSVLILICFNRLALLRRMTVQQQSLQIAKLKPPVVFPSFSHSF